eukprot:m.924 g.924  ORF g.924 m.924 type:complete len:71 (+) comp5183_c0_seq1:408-620(+)
MRYSTVYMLLQVIREECRRVRRQWIWTILLFVGLNERRLQTLANRHAQLIDSLSLLVMESDFELGLVAFL